MSRLLVGHRAPSCAVWVLGLLACQAQAQGFGAPPDSPMAAEREITVGLGLAREPAYLGADEHRTRALPMLQARWRNGWFAGVGGVGYRFPSDSALSAGLKLSVDPGRDQDDAQALRGMGDIPARPEIGGFLNYRLFGPVSLGASARYGSGKDRDGLLADLGMRVALPLSGSQRLMAHASLTWANRSAMQSQFGVTQEQAVASGYASQSASAGVRDVTLGLGYAQDFAQSATLLLGVNGRNLLGDAKSSPLTQSRQALSANAMLAFKF